MLSGWIVVRAAGLGASPATLARMTGNVLVDATVGSVPVLEDMFDFGFKANQAQPRPCSRATSPTPSGAASSIARLVIAVAVVAVLILVGSRAALVGWLVFVAVRAVGW